MKRATIISNARHFAALAALAALAACGGGAPTEENPATGGGSAPANYNGPAPATADVQAFKLNVWDNLQSDDRCGACHRDSQTPRFVRADDVNLAYQEANTVVDLANPGLSRMVQRVAQGHHCWLADNNACADTMTRWINAWAQVTEGGGGRQIVLTAPTLADPQPSRVLPATGTDGNPSFASTVHPLLTTYCAGCHRQDAPTPQQPYFASSDVNLAYEQSRTRMNLDAPAMSRFVVRLRSEFHNCWNVGGSVDCAASAQAMENAIAAFAGGIPSTPIPTQWVTSKALGLYGGTVASGGSRYDNNVIALYEFKTGTGTVAYDTSGVEPALDLTLSTTNVGGYQWVGGWGVQFTGGKAQGLTTTSRKLRDMIGSTGEYSIEAWAAPANVTQEEARIVSYSGGLQTRNFMLGQTLYNYDFFSRSSASPDLNGTALSTPDAREALQATLQHVVVTFSPVDGRRIFVNGELISSSAGGSTIGTWDDTLAFVLGNEASGNRPWLGTLRLVAVHNRALTDTQIQQNFDAGVGEKYLLLFSVEHVINMPQSYVMFEVSQYDSHAYLFSYPKLISLDANALPGGVRIRGMRIGINGVEPLVGQAYIPLDVTVDDGMYSSVAGANLSNVGTIVALERGPAADEFFLTFEQLGSMTNVRTAPTPLTPPPPADVTRPSAIGVRTFDGINETFANITGVSKNNASVRTTFTNLKQQLPTVETFEGFLASHQIGVAQLAIAYCSEMVNSDSLRTAFFNNANPGSLGTPGERSSIIDPVVARVLGSGLSSQPDPTAMSAELEALIANTTAVRAPGLCVSSACGGERTLVVMKAVCAVGLASGATIIQ